MEIAGGDPQLFAQLLGEFRRSATECVDELSILPSQQEWFRIAHRLKGIALSFGAQGLAEAAAAAEISPWDTDCLRVLRAEIERIPEM